MMEVMLAYWICDSSHELALVVLDSVPLNTPTIVSPVVSESINVISRSFVGDSSSFLPHQR